MMTSFFLSTKYTKCLVMLVIVVVMFMLGIFAYLGYSNFNKNENLEVGYSKKSERMLGDETQNSLYKVSDGENIFFVVTNKILKPESKYLGKSVQYLGSDIFWNPEVCAQMKSFYTGERIFFFEMIVVNPEENNGQDFANVMYVYDIGKNTLETYFSSEYLNIVDFQKVYLNNGEKEIAVMLRNEENKDEEFVFNIENYRINKIQAELKNLNKQEGKKREYKKDNNIFNGVLDIRPYILTIFEKKTREKILHLEEKDNVYHFIIGRG